MQTDILSKAIIQVSSLFTSPFGLFALIADPNVSVATETIISKEKINLRWSMFNLENNNKNRKHSLLMTDKKFNIVTSLQRRFQLMMKTNWLLLKREFKDTNNDLLFSTLYRYLLKHNLIRLYLKSRRTGCFIPWNPAVPTRVIFCLLCRLFCFVVVCIWSKYFLPRSAGQFLRILVHFCILFPCKLNGD